MRVLRFLSLACLTISLVSGCGRPLRALPSENQISIDDDRGILEKRSGVAVYVRPSAVPWDDDDRLAAFSVELTNDRDAPLAVSHEQFLLVGEDDSVRRAVDPSDLERPFSKVVAETADQAAANPGGEVTVMMVNYRPYCRPRYRRHYYRRRYYRSPYYGYWYYGWGPFPYRYYYYDNDYEQQLSRERISQFLSELWRERELAPKEVMAGYVVFAYHPAKKETVTLRLDLDAAAAGEPQPGAAAAAEPLRFEFQFMRK
jgi:hypothetical protein